MPFKCRKGISYRKKNYERKKTLKSRQNKQSSDTTCIGTVPATEVSVPSVLEEFADLVSSLHPVPDVLNTSQSSDILKEFSDIAVHHSATQHHIPKVTPVTYPTKCVTTDHSACNSSQDLSIDNIPEPEEDSIVESAPVPEPAIITHHSVHIHDHPSYNNPSKIPAIGCTVYSLPYNSIRKGLGKCFLPPGWVYQGDSESIQVSYLMKNKEKQPEVTRNLTVFYDLCWSVVIHGEHCEKRLLFSNTPPNISSLSTVVGLINAVHSARICDGNPDHKFHESAAARNGVFRSNGKHGSVVVKKNAHHFGKLRCTLV
ncbi:uncharacterized protein LOC144362642 [Saccoglossus kowalevskii]